MIGKVFGHYRILEKIGQGGMGEVYLADDTSLQRKVALKFLPPEMQRDASARQRLVREARSAAALDHPYICHINEVSEAGGRDFIVMEYVEGQTLKERLAREPLPLKEAKQIGMEVLEALEKAHEKGIVHRDLKPANVMLTPEGHAKVMDFGLAKQLIPAGATESQQETLSALTQSGTISGTLAYMSPEQMQGKTVDARSDLFSFGIVLYEMLTGVHPFDRATAIETASAIFTDTPLPLDQHKPGIPRPLQDIVGKLLAKNPLQRYRSAHEVHADLGRILLNGQPAATGWRRSRWIWVAVGLIVLVFGVVPMTWWVRDNYFKSPQVALAFQERDWILIADFENLTGDQVFDRSLQTAMTVGIQQSQYVNVLPPARVEQALQHMRKKSGIKLDETLACEIAVREGVKAVLVSTISNVGGVYSLTARLVEPRERSTVMSKADQAAGKSQVLASLDSLAKTIRRELGESLQKISNQNLPLPKATTASLEALELYADGLKINSGDSARYELMKQSVAIDPDFALAHASLGVECYLHGDRKKGEQHFIKALSLIDRLTTKERLWIHAMIEDRRGNSDKAVEHYRTYLAQYPDEQRGWFNLGWHYMAMLGQDEKAIAAFKRVLEIDPSESASYINIATCYKSMKQYKAAIENYEKAFELRPSALTHVNVNGEYGFLLVRMGNLRKAEDTFRKMIAEGSKARGYRSMALLAMYQGKLSLAIGHLKKAILMNKAAEYKLNEYRDHMFLAAAYRLKGRNAEVISELAEANPIISEIPIDPFFIAILAKAYARMGKTGEVSRLLKTMTLQAKNLIAISAINRTSQADQAAISLVNGENALARGRGNEAVEFFELSCQIDPSSRNCLEPLAFAYRKLGKPQNAAEKYKEIIADIELGHEMQEHWILAHYELAKIYLELGDIQKAKEYYGRFFNIWKDADPDIPILKQAKAEYARLQ